MSLFKKKQKQREHKVSETQLKTGSEMNFAAKESYKVLRTNLSFMMGEKENNVFGVTSSIPAEGKSLTTINLAISFAEMGKRVLLVEADMRKPVVEKYFNIKAQKGLSKALAGHYSPLEAIYRSARFRNLYYIVAGEIPPNPAELLSSKNMEMMLEKLSKEFDVILIDLPPVNAVSDATIVSKYTKGIVLVVRGDYVNKDEVAETLRQLEVAEAKVLGFVYNYHDTGKGKYYTKGYNYSSYSTYEDVQTEDVTPAKKVAPKKEV